MAMKLVFDRDKVYIFPWYIADLAVTKDIKRIAPGAVSQVVAVFNNDFIEIYYDTDSALKIGNYFFKKLQKDKVFFKKTCKNIYNLSEKLSVFYRQLPTENRLSKFSNKELSVLYRMYDKKLIDLRVWGWVPGLLDGFEKSYLTEYLQKELRKFLATKKMEERTGSYYTLLSSNEKKSEVQGEELARLNLLLKFEQQAKWPEIKKYIIATDENNLCAKYHEVYLVLKKHIKQFGWLTYAYSGPLMSEHDLLVALKDNLSKEDDVTKQKKNLLNHYCTIKKNKQQLIKKIQLPKDLVYMFEVSAEFMFIKDYRKGIYQKSYVEMDRVLQEIGHRLGLSLKQVKYCVYDEIHEMLVSEKKKEEYFGRIIKRPSSSCYLIKNGIIKIWEGEEMKKILPKLLKGVKKDENITNITELRGMVAYSGKVKGVVKIVLTKEDISKVREGDILVSSATNPDLLVAMKKAAAFVTDIGGIVSHAAILSRELKKPCVVGTKIATHVFKDGDVAEVDAEEGIVRKIS